MSVDWLHISDFHIKSGDSYDRDVVLGALVRSVRYFRDQGRRPDLIFATGDIAHSGQEKEYDAATPFFDAICEAAGIEKGRLFVIPGNHDVDRDLGAFLARTLSSGEQADKYFHPAAHKPHVNKQGAFLKWHKSYFAGIRIYAENSTCCDPEIVEVAGCKIGVLSLNSALFCQDDHDHAKLWVGRRCLDDTIPKVARLKADLNIALVHHPLAGLHDDERSNVSASLQEAVDIILRGHLHETDVQEVVGVTGNALHIAAGTAYQTRKYPNRALYVSFRGAEVEVFPFVMRIRRARFGPSIPASFPRRATTRGFSESRV